MKAALSHNLKLLKAFSNWSAREMGEKFGVSGAYVESLVKGTGSLRADFASKVCNYYGITSEQLTGQKLTDDDLNATGSSKTVTEVRLEAALQRIKDLEEIIKLLKKKTNT